MRFIIREQDSERLLAAGLFNYQQNGRPIGVTEEWRLTEVMNQYRILRTDIDERESESGQSTLFHLVISPENQPERLKIRLFSPLNQGWADIIMSDNIITLTQDLGERRWEDEASYDDLTGFLYSSVTWLGCWISRQESRQASRIYYLNKNSKYRLDGSTFTLQRREGEPITVGGQTIPVDRYSVDLPGKKQEVWIDKFGLTVRADIKEDLTAVETRYIRRMKSESLFQNIE